MTEEIIIGLSVPWWRQACLWNVENLRVRKSETPQTKLLLLRRQPQYTQCVIFLAMNGIGDAKLPRDRDEDIVFYTKLYF